MRHFLGEHGDAISDVRKVLEIHPDHVLASYVLGSSYAHISMHEESFAVLEKLATNVERLPFFLALLGWAYAAAGLKDKAVEIAGELKERAEKKYVPPLCLAWIYGRLGVKEEAFRWLERAIDERYPFLIYLDLNRSMFHESLRSEPLFDELARQMNLSNR
jgi:tetratricopeptide (TPR) repeat protein